MPTAWLVCISFTPVPAGRIADVAVGTAGDTRHVIDRLVFHVQRRETAVSEPAEHRVVERDRVVVIQNREFDVMNTAPAHTRLLSRAYAGRFDESRWETHITSCHPSEVTLTFYVFLWPHAGMEQALIAYEDAVLTLVNEHDGKVVHRARTDGAEGRPLEIQLFEWASQEAMARYMSDPRRTALAADREQAIARTEIVPVQIVSDRGVSDI
jgi:hypothetical protein